MEVKTFDRQQDGNTTIMWHSQVYLDNNVVGEGAIDKQKKISQSKAILLFFKSFFPPASTWLDVVELIKREKNPIQRVIEMKQNIQI